MNNNLATYYAQRAFEYEKIYQKPERQTDLARLKEMLSSAFIGRDVLEIACGTGYWTQHIAVGAKSILATDCNREVIEIAQQKRYNDCAVHFQESDTYSLHNIKGKFDAGFCGFWYSHIPKPQIREFLRVFHAKLTDNALIIMIDNKYVHSSSTPISREDSASNTYQIRTLTDGSTYEVLKNFPTPQELKKSLTEFSQNFEYIDLNYYWLVKYTAG
jgi:demethylmenaquinone methyltransferase/2-methoxy-6-polyprenyl-1,4-benzoquinol methylase